MTITAKYESKCPACGRRIAVGSRVAWTKGSPAKHITCPTGAPAPVKSTKAAAPRKPSKAGTTEGATSQLFRYESTRIDPTVEVGRTFRAGKRAGKHAGQMVTVVGAEIGGYVSREMAEDMDDFGQYGYPLTLHIRPATPEEAAPILAAEKAKAAKQEARKELMARAQAAQAQHHDTYPRNIPGAVEEGASRTFSLEGRPTSTTQNTVSVWPSGHVLWFHGGYYDDYRPSWGTSEDGTEVLALLATAGIAETK